MDVDNKSATQRKQMAVAAVRKPEAKRLVEMKRSPRDVLDSLIAADLLSDAVRFLAMIMPKRPAIWWGALCIWHGYKQQPPVEAAAALEATLLWLRDPSELNRREVDKLGRTALYKTPAGALALAAFMSGGSISRPNLPYVKPADHVTGQLVAGAVMLAAVQFKPFEYLDHYRQFLAIGREVADGRLGWLTVPPTPVDPLTARVDPPKTSIPAPHFHVGAGHHHAHSDAAVAIAQEAHNRPQRNRPTPRKDQHR